MSFNIDIIRRVDLITTPETITTDWTSESFTLDNRFGGWSVQVKYQNGTAPDMKIYIQLSNDNDSFGDIVESQAIVTDTDGSVLYDLDGSGAGFARIRIEVAAGSIDVTQIRYLGKQAH